MAVYQVKVVGEIIGNQAINVYFFEGEITDEQMFVNDLAALYDNTVMSELAQQAKFSKITIKELQPVEGPERDFVPSGWPTQGQRFAETSAGLLAGLISFKGAQAKYPVNARKYIWGISEERISQNQLHPDMVNALQALGDGLVNFSSAGANGSFVCYRRSTGETNPFGSAFARPLVATQRRRSGL